MPKLRNAATDLGKFAQWIGRKCRNHNPLEELALPGSRVSINGKQLNKRPDQYKAHTKGDVYALAEDESVILYEAGGRTFEITVREVEPETHAGKAREKIGY